MYFSTNLDRFFDNKHYIENNNFASTDTFGITAFELHARPEYLDITSSEELAQLKSMTDKCGWKITSLHAPAWQGPYDISALDEAEREEAVEWNKKTIQAVKALGGSYCVTHGGDRVEDDGERPARLQQSLKSLKEIIECAAREEIVLSLENVLPPYICQDLSETLYYQQQISSPWLRPIFDVGHAFLSDGLEPWFKVLGQFNWQAIHVTDNHGRVLNTSNDDQHLFPFEGIIPWDEVFKQLQRINFDGPITIETAIKPELFKRLKKIWNIR
ncbi:MAG: sugar phosphate isomerase/epimerase [Victivallaceae bacterium]|nr:sugar phosphate isomerase/epimerase [Victivallaceae bacterium]